MYEDFVKFCFETFPQISSDSKKKVSDLLKQYKSGEEIDDIFLDETLDIIAQGDIVSEVEWIVPIYNEKNEKQYLKRKEKAFLLSTTCDATRREHLVFAPLMKIDSICKEDSDKWAIKSNCTTQFLYLPGGEYDDYAVDLGSIFSLPRCYFEQLLADNEVKREASLTNEGLYLFVAKFTLTYMRWQDPEIEIRRSKESRE